MSHLTHFGVGNFKVFNELTDFELAPLTILTGKNNSGKSSLIKALMLFKKNLKPNRPISMWGNNLKSSFEELEFGFPELKLGSPNEIFNFNSKREVINFNFPINNLMLPKGQLRLNYQVKEKKECDDEKLELKTFSIYNDNKVIVKFDYQLIDNNIIVVENHIQIDFLYFINRVREIHKIYFNKRDTDFKKIEFGERIGLFKISQSQKSSKEVEPFWELLSSDKLIIGFDNMGHGELNVEESDLQKIQILFIKVFKKGFKFSGTQVPGCINKFFSNYSYLIDEQILNIFNQDDILKRKYHDQILFYTKGTSFLFDEKVSRPYVKTVLHPFFDYIKSLINNIFSDFIDSWENVSYLPSIRAKNERLYMVSKEGYAIQEFDQHSFERITRNEKLNQFLLSVLRDFEIGENIKVTTYQRTATEIKIIRKDRDILLSDLGFGYAQLVPIILTIFKTAEKWSYWKYKNEEDVSILPNPIILIEEPESNLHPDFQAKLADLFVDATRLFGIQFIIETHSEYLIRRLQYLTARKDINPDDISIYYFNNPNKIKADEKQIFKIEVRKDGILKQDFGSGFYDQATNSTFDLFRLIGDN